jgi:hypothetical protein
VNFYCKSVAEEHDPRGPEGPYQFKDRSVPLFVIKKWDGTTLSHQLGFPRTGGDKAVAGWIEKALKENGPITPPQALKPLIQAMKKAQVQIKKGRPGNGWKDLGKVVKLGQDTRKFPEGPPTVAREAAALMEKFLSEANAAIDAATAMAEDDPASALKALRALRSPYGAIPEIKARLAEETKKLK